uniref:Retroviral polymerase SH3-like domain-containing protein n=1 Tax=Physcomitrium patens TaxID=3218 RepID=A0A2K1KEE3_PHYPA|nr:hypothetical protein PHYPA_008493 [Physcomitrium patens]
MREGDSIIKHIHIFRAYMEQLLVVGSINPDDKAIFILIRSFSLSHRSFITSLRRIFGCIAHVFISKETRKKLDFYSLEAIFLEYSEESKAYRIKSNTLAKEK